MARKGYSCKTFVFNGKTYYCYGASDDEAIAKASARKALLEAGVKEISSTMSVEKWCSEWLSNYKDGTVGDAWYKQIDGIIRNYILPSIGDKRLCDVKPMHITAMLNKNASLSASHGKKILQITRQIFDSAEENDMISKSPARHVKMPHFKEKVGNRALSDKERKLTLIVAEKYPREGLFFLIMLYCGLRPQEVSALRMQDYDKDSKTIHVHSARKADGSVGAPKSKSGVRSVPVPDVLCNKLNALDKKPNELIVTSAQGQPLTKTSQKRLWHRFKRLMDIENGAELFRGGVVETTLADDLTPYTYRHTYCTDLQTAGVPLVVASRLMGHSSISITADIYTHNSQESFDDAREMHNSFCTKFVPTQHDPK